MKRSLTTRNMAVGAALLFAAAGPGLFAADDLPKGETILDKYIEVTGGKAAYEKRHNETTSGAMEFAANGIKGTITAWHAEPDKSYMELNITGVGKIQEGSDGKVAWALSAIQGARVKEGEEKAAALQAAKFNADLNWREIYKQAQTMGVESVDGKDCYKVVLTPNEGNPNTRYYDKQSGLLVKMSMIAKSPMGDIPVESLVSDYRKEGDILMPHKVTQKGAGQEIVIMIDTVKNNADMPKDRFDPPDEIKALLVKK